MNVLSRYLSLFLVIISFRSVSARLFIPFPMAVSYAIDIITIGILLFIGIKRKAFSSFSSLPIILFELWVGIGVIRGLFAAENYYLYKNLFTNTKTMLLPISVFAFSNPLVTLNVLKTWNRYVVVIFLACFTRITHDSYAFVLSGFYYIYAIFFFLIQKKWFWITTIALLLVGTGFDNRSALVKLLFSLVLMCGLWLKINNKILLRSGQLLLFIIPIVLFYLGITGTYNVFQGFPEEESHIVVFGKENEEKKLSDNNFSADTRTFMYEEVLTSAVIHDYVLFGRSLSRGSDSQSIGAWEAQKNGLDLMERNANEAGLLNVFTWLGLIGVFLYSIIFIQASILGVYFSNNIYVKYFGLAVAFHWLFSWIEEAFTFAAMDFMLWIIIAICFSPQFRKMTNNQFEIWIQSLFVKEDVTPYHKYGLLRYLLNYHLQSKLYHIIRK